MTNGRLAFRVGAGTPLVGVVVDGLAGDGRVKAKDTTGVVDGGICPGVLIGGSDLVGDSWETVGSAVDTGSDPGVKGLAGRKILRIIANWVSKSLLLISLLPMLYCVVIMSVTGPTG